MMPFSHMNPRMLNQVMASQRFAAAAAMAQAGGQPHGPHHRGGPPGPSSMASLRFPGTYFM